MGCGASVNQTATMFMPSPLEQAIKNEDTACVRTLLTPQHKVNEMVKTAIGEEAPLVMMTKLRSSKVMKYILETFTFISQSSKDNAISQLLSCTYDRDQQTLVELLVHHGGTVQSPLALCRSLTKLPNIDGPSIKSIVEGLLRNSDKYIIQGAILNMLCNSNVKLRAKMSDEYIHDEYLENLIQQLFQNGLNPQAYWSNEYSDMCLTDDAIRPFRPTSLCKPFIKAIGRLDLLPSVMVSGLIFQKPCENLMEYIFLFYKAGCFLPHKNRQNFSSTTKLSTLNPFAKLPRGFTSLNDYLEYIYRNPYSLTQCCVVSIRMSFNCTNVFKGMEDLKTETSVPLLIQNMLLLDDCQ